MICMCLGIAIPGRAQEVKVSAKLDKTTIVLGDQTVLRLSAEVPLKGNVVFPLLADTLSAKVQIVAAGVPDTLVDQNRPEIRVISRAYTITSFDAGLQMVPALVFSSDGKDYLTDALPLDVKSVSVDTTKAIYDIKQPLGVSYTFWDWLRDQWYWLVLAVLLLAALLGTWYYFRKVKKPAPVVVKAAPAVPFHVRAIDQLNALRDRKLWQQGEVKAYYSELTDILRAYLEKRYKINALEQTSDEILAALRSVAIPAGGMKELKEILLLADLVKFAKVQPLNTDNENTMDGAIHFIKEQRDGMV